MAAHPSPEETTAPRPEGALPLLPEEIAHGMALGLEPGVGPLALPSEGVASPRAALESVLAFALSKPPCVFSFSGGRDSSALLAMATAIARREGLEPPVPATLRIAGSEAADESSWQELVLSHLGIEDWLRIDVRGQLDLVGPVAAEVLSRHGLLWPFNTHFHVPIFEAAAGGTVVTGFGGDELGLSSSTARAERIIAARRVRRRSDLLILGLALAPKPVRRSVHRRRERKELAQRPWLTARAVSVIARAAARDAASIPLGWGSVLTQALWPSRYVQLTRHSFRVAASTYGTDVVHPFVEPQVLAALAAAGGFAGLGDRTAIMGQLFGDLLPEQTVRRESKASFGDAMWTAESRTFAEEWSGSGLPEGLLEGQRLRAEWTAEQPHALTSTAIQAAWLFDRTSPAR